MRASVLTVAALSLAGVAWGSQASSPASKPERLVGWVSDGHCGAQHMKTGGAACVRKCIAGAVHLNPDWKPGGMVFVTEDKRVWLVDNPDALWGHESQQLEILADRSEPKRSLKVHELVKVLQR